MTGTATDPHPGLQHAVDAVGDAALVSDRGRRRNRNEDAATLAVRPGWIGLLVADGVGGKPEGDRASVTAVGAGRDALLAAYDHALTADGQLLAAVHAASGAVADLAHDGVQPSTTFVAAVTDGATVVAVSVGDSRAYWVPDGATAVALSRDDSFAEEQIALGADPAAARKGPYAHVITRWLGARSPALDPAVVTAPVDGPGWLLLCTDGFWQYLPKQWGLGRVTDPAEMADHLVGWANAQGGSDNITVALARIG